jgi:hypothetical protein
MAAAESTSVDRQTLKQEPVSKALDCLQPFHLPSQIYIGRRRFGMTEYERCVVTVYERYVRASYHCRSVRAFRLQRAPSHGRRGVARATSWFADRALKARIGALTEK